MEGSTLISGICAPYKRGLGYSSVACPFCYTMLLQGIISMLPEAYVMKNHMWLSKCFALKEIYLATPFPMNLLKSLPGRLTLQGAGPHRWGASSSPGLRELFSAAYMSPRLREFESTVRILVLLSDLRGSKQRQHSHLLAVFPKCLQSLGWDG